MTTVADLVADAKRIAYGSMTDQLNFLASEYVPGSGEATMLMDVASISPGMVISSGLNVWYVTGVEPSLKRVLLYAGYQNSKDAVVASGQPVLLRPRVTDWLVFQNINDAIRRMSSRVNGLYKAVTEEVQPDAGSYGVYTLLGSGIEGIVAVRYRENWWTDEWVRVADRYWRWEPELNAIRLVTDRVPWSGVTLSVTYQQAFSQATSLADTTASLGLADSMVDIPPLGAAEALVRTTESRRMQVSAQGDPRRADEVAAGGNSSAARELGKQFDKRCDDEYIRLVNVNPWMQSI